MKIILSLLIVIFMTSCNRYITTPQALTDASLPNLSEWYYVGHSENVYCYQNESGIKYIYEKNDKIFAILWLTDEDHAYEYEYFLAESGYLTSKEIEDTYYSPETGLVIFFTELDYSTVQIEIYPLKTK